MPSEEPPQLSGRHRDTLAKIFLHPVSHNIEWRRVIALLEEAGTVRERRDGKLEVSVGSAASVLEPPRGKDLTVQQVLDVRRMLATAGYGEGGE